MIITLKSLHSNIFTVKSLSYEGKTSYRTFTYQELLQYIFDWEAYAEYHGLSLPKFIIPQQIKEMIKKQHNANNTNNHS